MARTSATERFKTILGILEQEFGQRQPYRPHPPVEQALFTVLLKDGQEAPAERALRRLQREFVDWNETRVSEAEYLDRILGKGFPQGVGELVRSTLTAIFNHSQAMNLDDIMGLDPQAAGTRLKKLDVMPSRVSGELLLANLNYGKLPEGAGLLRVARRTKLVRPGPPHSQMRGLRRISPNTRVPRVFHAFEMLAERICTAEDFDCAGCPIKSLCPTGVEKLKQLEIQKEKERQAQEAEKERSRKKRRQGRKARARKKAATKELKKAIQLRSKKLNISTSKQRERHRNTDAAGAVMMQTPSGKVKRVRNTKEKKKMTRKTSRSGQRKPATNSKNA